MSIKGFNVNGNEQRYDYEYLDNKPTIPAASTATPQMDGTASAGSSAAFSRGDHVHPSDTTKADKAKTAPVIYDTANGAIASFTDGADGLPCKSVVAQITPVQHFNGYANPWPAGGGSNMWDEEWEVGFISPDTGANVSQNTTIRSTNYIPILPETNYYDYVGDTAGGNNLQARFYDASKNYIGYVDYAGIAILKNAVFKTPADAYFMRFTAQAGYGTTYNNDIAINYPSTVTTYSPYSNICPITGHTGLTVWDDPVYGGTINFNQYAKVLNGDNWSALNGTTTWTDGVAKYTITTVASPSYNNRVSTNYNYNAQNHKYFAAFTHRESKTGLKVYFCNVASNSSGASADSTTSWVRSENVFTITVSGEIGTNKWLAFRLQDGTGAGAATRAVGDWMEVKDAIFIDLTQMFGAGNEPSTVEEFKALFPQEYYAYNTGEITCVSKVNGDPYRQVAVSWQSEAGTVYGGTLDVVSGVLTATKAVVTGDWKKSDGYNHVFYRNGLGNKTFATGTLSDALSNLLPTVQANNLAALDAIEYGVRVTDIIYAVNKDCSTADEFNAWAANNGLQVVFTLATPLTYQLTPVEIDTLLGANNIWADTGNVAVEYPADTKLYINKVIAAI